MTRGVDERSFAERVREFCAGETAGSAGWQVADEVDERSWVHVSHPAAGTPLQGWKLHVSATVSSAPFVLERVLETLARDPAFFKVASSPAALAALNQGQAGFSQIGKFVTVYPDDDAHAVRLAAALDEATRGLAGPEVPSDRPLRAGSLVHYRYGGFDGRQVMTLLGEVVPAVELDGELVPDRRTTSYLAPAQVRDPFVAAGLAEAARPRGRVLAGRYAIAATFNRTPRGAIHLAIDIETPRRCIVKEATPNGAEAGGLDAPGRLRREADVLRLLADDPRFPRVLDLHDADGTHLLVLEDVEGDTLDARVAAHSAEGRHVPVDQAVEWACELASMLDAIHRQGLVYSDLKPSNVVVTPDGRLRLLDLELAADGTDAFPYRFGTQGYASPEQRAHASPSVADDIHALGALLYFVVTGAEPYAAPLERHLLERPLELLNPAASPGLLKVVSRCLQQTPSRRYRSAAALETAIRRAGRVAPPPTPPFGDESLAGDDQDARSRSGANAHRLADTLCAYAERPSAEGPLWTSTHPAAGPGCPHVNAGSAGPLLALAELVRVLGGERRRAVLRAAAGALAAQQPLPGARPAGLYVGEAGVGAALLRAGQVLGDDEVIRLAAERGRIVASLPFASPDLFHGTAGRVRFHLLLWDALGDEADLAAAVRGGESVLAAAERRSGGEVCWRIPDGYDSMSGQAQLGYAHGAAGIADVLLDLFESTRDSRFHEAAEAAFQWIARQAKPALDDGDGVGWPAQEGGAQTPPFWCHGATGIGRFLIHAARSGIEGAGGLLEAAARSAARGARWAGPTQCHGLAGNIEFLLDVYRLGADRSYLAEARSLARLLDAFAAEQDGLLVWPSENPSVFSPDYMVGFAGVATCMLRLSRPDELAHLLTRDGFSTR